MFTKIKLAHELTDKELELLPEKQLTMADHFANYLCLYYNGECLWVSSDNIEGQITFRDGLAFIPELLNKVYSLDRTLEEVRP